MEKGGLVPDLGFLGSTPRLYGGAPRLEARGFRGSRSRMRFEARGFLWRSRRPSAVLSGRGG
eukprot:1670032-Pyramimonas_sp.AAC.1